MKYLDCHCLGLGHASTLVFLGVKQLSLTQIAKINIVTQPEVHEINQMI